jgi:hypothetical protein
MTRHLSFRKTLGQLVTIESQITNPIRHYEKQPYQQKVTAFSEQVESGLYPLEFRHISPEWDSRISQKWPRLFSKMWFKWYFELLPNASLEKHMAFLLPIYTGVRNVTTLVGNS